MGALCHRHWRCDAEAERRRQLGDLALTAKRDATDGDLLWERLLVHHPRTRWPRPAQTPPAWGGAEAAAWRRTFESKCWSYASGSFSTSAWRRRVGWAVVQVEGDRVALRLSGPLPYPLQTVDDGELFAALQWASHLGVQGSLGVDTSQVVNAIAKGRSWCCSSSRPLADLWKRIV